MVVAQLRYHAQLLLKLQQINSLELTKSPCTRLSHTSLMPFEPPELPLQDSNPHHGIDCNCVRTNGIREQNKQQQIVLTTQVVKMILKIDNGSGIITDKQNEDQYTSGKQFSWFMQCWYVVNAPCRRFFPSLRATVLRSGKTATVLSRNLPIKYLRTVAVRVSSSAGERLSRPAFMAEVTRDLSAPADSADSAQTVATSAAAEASTVLSFLSAPVLLLSSQADTTPAIAAASWATETAAWAFAVCSRSSSRLFLLRLPAMGMLSIKYPLRIALMCPMFSCSFSVETKRFCQFTSLC
uniref:Uncharacterized protein n=1 Tax=Oryza punctata TaxID=4537 RepID=A0A0E0MAY6_ORYPU